MVYIYRTEEIIVRHRSIEALLLEMSESHHHSCDARPLLLWLGERPVYTYLHSQEITVSRMLEHSLYTYNCWSEILVHITTVCVVCA